MPRAGRSGSDNQSWRSASGPALAAAAAIIIWAAQGHAGDRLEIMVENASEPFSRADGTGYANDLVRAAFAAAGVDVVFDVVPYARCKDALVRGLTPACFSMSRSAGAAVRFSDQPLFAVEAVLFQNRDRPLILDREGRAAPGSRIGIVNGYEYPPELDRLAAAGAVMELSVNETALLKKLAKKRLEGAVIMTSGLEPSTQPALRAGVADQVETALAVGSVSSYIGFSTRHEEGETARRRFNAGYLAIQQNGTAEAIRHRWGSPP
jgi:ABC-type amino acid transport substrate-binding protein